MQLNQYRGDMWNFELITIKQLIAQHFACDHPRSLLDLYFLETVQIQGKLLLKLVDNRGLKIRRRRRI